MNSTETLLKFWFLHNEQIILWVFAGVLIAITVMTINAIFTKEEDSQSGSASFKDLEESLKKLLEERPTAAASTPSPAFNPSELEGDLVPAPMVAAIREELEAKKAELQKMQVEIQGKNSEIEIVKKQHAETTAQLQAAATQGMPAADPAELNTLKTRLKELENKLSEYTVIEDDIADLSMYKDENSRLKAELDKLKAGGAVVPTLTTPTPAPSASGPLTVNDENDPVMAEFAAAVAEQQAATTTTPTPPAPAELAKAAPAAPSVDELQNEQLDTDRMLAEMADLSNMPIDEEAAAKVLEAEPDTDKMTAEAADLQAADKAS